MSINIEFKKNNSTKNGSITYRINNKGDRHSFTSLVKVGEQYWNRNTKKVRKNHDQSLMLNDQIRKEINSIEQLILKASIEGAKLSRSEVLATFDQISGKRQDASYQTGIKSFLEYIKLEVSKGRYQNYQLLFKTLDEFNNTTKNDGDFSLFTITFYSRFVNYLIKDKGLSNGGAQKYVTTLKSFLKWTFNEGYHKNVAYQKFKTPKSDPPILPLEEKHIVLIEDVTLTEIMDSARDIFLFMIYTGLRVSDAMKLKSSQVKKDFIRLPSKKTKRFLVIPISKKTRIIINKYADSSEFVLPQLAHQTINRLLKEIGKKAGLTEKVTGDKQYLNEIIESEFYLYEKLTNHTARKTFITQCLRKGMNSEMIMKITGHKKYSSFSRYVNFSDTDLLKQIKLVWDE